MGRIYNYHGYRMTVSDCTTTVYRISPGGSPYEEVRRLYEIYNTDGDCVKSYGTRPLLTSLSECRNWIDAAYDD